MTPLRWVLFDLNGALVDPVVMAQPLGDAAADEDLVTAAVDDAVQLAMVTTLTGGEAAFADLVRAALDRRLRLAGRDPGLADDALGLMSTMPAFIDAPAALEQLRGIGLLRLGVLTQSAADAGDAVLRFAGLRDRIEVVMGAASPAASSPTRAIGWRSSASGRRPGRSRSSRRTGGTWPARRPPGWTGWVARRNILMPAAVPEPDVSGRDLLEVAEGLAKLAR